MAPERQADRRDRQLIAARAVREGGYAGAGIGLLALIGDLIIGLY